MLRGATFFLTHTVVANGQTNKCRVKHNLLGKGNEFSSVSWKHVNETNILSSNAEYQVRLSRWVILVHQEIWRKLNRHFELWQHCHTTQQLLIIYIITTRITITLILLLLLIVNINNNGWLQLKIILLVHLTKKAWSKDKCYISTQKTSFNSAVNSSCNKTTGESVSLRLLNIQKCRKETIVIHLQCFLSTVSLILTLNN